MHASRDDLINALTITEPLGPIAHERIVPDVLDDIVYDRIALFTDIVNKPHMLFLGRKGAGKSALLGQIRLGAQNEETRGNIPANDEPTHGRNYVLYIYSWEQFNKIVRSVGRLARKDELLDELVPTEYFAELWYQILWEEIIHHFYNYHSFNDESRQLLNPVDRYVNADEMFDGSADAYAKKLFLGARDCIINFLEKKKSKLYFLFDSMDNYPVRNPIFSRIISGLFQGLTKVNDDSSRIIVSFCIPEEIESFMTTDSGNLLKDFSSSSRIRWRPVDLIRVIAHRMRLSASVHDSAFYDQTKDLDFSIREDLHHLFDLCLPTKITNSRGTEEDPLAYIIRHTQLLPRHTIAIFNQALSLHFKSTKTYFGMSEDSIRSGISSVEKMIASQILKPYEQIYPKLLAQCRVIIPDLDPICDRSALQRVENRFHRLIEDDVGSIWHKLFEIGIIGRSTTKSDSEKPQALPDSRYCYGQFFFNIDGSFSTPTDGEFCFHPVFSRAFGMIRRNGDKRVVYPAHIDLENIYDQD